jgi:hypothetical protein
MRPSRTKPFDTIRPCLLGAAMMLAMASTAGRALACVTSADCADGSVCNGDEVCQAGVCIQGISLTCDDGNPCTRDACDPVNGCTYTAASTCLLAGKKFRLASGADLRMAFQTAPQMTGASFPGNFTNDDPVVHGASLRVMTAVGDAFDNTYPLPRANWTYRSIPGANVGYAYKDVQGVHGPITLLVIRNAKPAKMKARGPLLNFSLGADPDPVKVAIRFGNDGRRYCMEFGGKSRFSSGSAYAASSAPAPTSCATCTSALDCNDGNPCTVDSCTAGVCQNAVVPNGTACDDADACTTGDVCQAGSCAGSPITCTPPLVCVAGTCE